MDNRDMELYAGIMRDRQQELRNELEMQVMFNTGLTASSGIKRRLLLSLAATVIIVTVAILAGAQFLA